MQSNATMRGAVWCIWFNAMECNAMWCNTKPRNESELVRYAIQPTVTQSAVLNCPECIWRYILYIYMSHMDLHKHTDTQHHATMYSDIYIYTHISPHVQMCGSKRQNLSKPFKKSLLSVETHLPHVFPSANEAVAFLLRRRAANYDWGSVSIIVMGVYPTINFNWGWFIIGFTTTHDIYIYINRGVCHDIRYMIIYHGVRHDTVYDICSGFFLCVYIYMYSVVAVGNLEWPNKSVRLNNNFPAAVWIFE